MDNIMRIVKMGMCIGCCACSCEHITYKENELGFPTPIVDEKCILCGNCLKQCPLNPEQEDED